MATNPKKLFSPEEYLELERQADYKSEYLDGEIFAMAGASEPHILIESNVIRELGNQLLDKPCQVYTSNIKIDLSRYGMYSYPDAAVVCGEPVFHDKHKDNLINPLVIVEVLSDSTRNYDRGEKFFRYRKLKTFKEYLLIAQHTPHVEHFVKQENNRWLLTEYDNLLDNIYLPSLDITIGVSSIYRKAKLNKA